MRKISQKSFVECSSSRVSWYKNQAG